MVAVARNRTEGSRRTRASILGEDRDRAAPEAVGRPLRVLLLIRSLGLGGAERQLVHLALGLAQRGCRVSVAFFYGAGPLLSALEGSGVRLVDLRKRGRWDVVRFSRHLRDCVRRERPHVIYSFLGGANVFAALVRPFTPKFGLVWSVRASDMDLSRYSWAHRLGYALECSLSRSADLIIANSAAGRQFAESNGFPSQRIAVVPNGIDTGRFHPDPLVRTAQRKAWGLMDDEVAVGILARLDPMKGHDCFLEAAKRVAAVRPDLRFFCIGEGPEKGRLEALAAELGISPRVHFAGRTDEPAMALNGLDIFCSASLWGEGFSNSVAEAMACGLRCVVTDVGDSAAILGDEGMLVPAGDAAALAKAILDQADAPPGPSDGARRRIAENFSIDRMVDSTLALLERSAGEVRSTTPG